MISQRCRHQGRGSVFNRCFTSSIDTCAAAWVTLAIPFLLLLCQDLLLILPQIADWYQYPPSGWVRFIFLHRPLLEPQGWREGVGERVCARNSQHQDDELVAPRGPPSVRWKQEQVDGIAETPVLPRRRGSTRRGSAAAGCQLAADSCAALVDGPPLPPRSRSTADCRPRCAAPAWD